MCGIGGIFNSNCKKDCKLAMEVMTASMVHRGPDAYGYYEDDCISLGHRRLAIIDLSPGGAQPKTDNSGRYVITFNGEIYNFKEVRAALPGYDFRSSSDTEVILAAYVQWGRSCVQHLTGQFAFAIWDKEDKTLFLARDRMGEKPLYYHEVGRGCFVFASELKAVLKSGLVPNVINTDGVVDFLKYQSVTAPKTLIKDVLQLMPGHTMVVSSSGVVISPYYHASSEYDPSKYSDIKVVHSEIRRLLTKAVQGQMMSDVPMGAFLSGGIDSSAIVALMAQNSSQRIDTFTIGFEDSTYDESKYATVIAKKFNTRHTSFMLDPNDFRDSIPDALAHMDAISGDGLNTYVVSQLAKSHGITVALSGLGGDDLFGGYAGFSRYFAFRGAQSLWRAPACIKKAISTGLLWISDSNRMAKLAQLVALDAMELPMLYALTRQVFSTEDLACLCPDLPYTYDGLIDQTASIVAKNSSLPLYGQYGLAEIYGYTSNVLLKDADRMAMAHSLEMRVPFFDHHLVSYCLGIPDKMKHTPHLPKKLLVDALRDLLPKEVTHRHKMGFSFPWDQWMRNELSDFVSSHITSLSDRGIFDKTRLLNYYEAYRQGRPDILWSKIWLLVILDYWMNKHTA